MVNIKTVSLNATDQGVILHLLCNFIRQFGGRASHPFAINIAAIRKFDETHQGCKCEQGLIAAGFIQIIQNQAAISMVE